MVSFVVLIDFWCELSVLCFFFNRLFDVHVKTIESDKGSNFM